MKTCTTNKLVGTLLVLGTLAAPAQATVTGVGTDTTTGANWRTAAALEADDEYGTDGYVIYGIDAADGVFSNPYAFDLEQTVLPAAITGVTTNTVQMWSGTGNFGTMEDPGNGNAITNAPLSVLLGNTSSTFTISRAAGTSFRLTLLVASGDGANVTYTTTVDDGSGGVMQSLAHTGNGLHYHVFDISSGSADVAVTVSAGNHFSLTGLAFDNVVVVAETTPPSIVPPTSPADEATGVLVGTDLVATFDENVALTGAGTVTIRDLGPGADVVIDLTGPDPDGSVSVTGADLTISLAADLAASNNYAVQISADAVEDLATTPNAFAGILDDTTWNFTTAADATAPTIVPPTSPADGASEVALDANLVAAFDESIAVGSGNITVKNLSEGTQTVIPVGDAQVSVSGTDLTIDLATDLNPSDDHAVQIDAGAVTDIAGNPFAGIADDTTWNFTTAADTTNPTLVLPTSPADEATGVIATSLVATFSEPIMATAPTVLHNWDFESNDGGFTVKVSGQTGSTWEHGDPDSTSPGGTVTEGAPGSTAGCWGTNLGLADDGHYLTPTVTCLRSPVIDLTSVAGAQLTFAEALDLEAGDTAVVNIIDDASDAVIAAAIYTADDSAAGGDANWKAVPALDLAAGVGHMVRIEWCLTGGTAEYLGWYIDDVQVTTTSAAATITIKNLTAATETTVAIADSSQVSISGDTLTVTPDTGLAFNSAYAIQIGASAITDLSGNFFAGINDDTTWNFATEAAVPIAVGMKIGLAPGPTPTDDPGNDWFDFTATNTTYNAIHNLDGDLVDGVNVQVAGSVGFNTAGEDNWVGLSTNGGGAPVEFVDSVTTDLLFNNVTITINGLDPALAYDIVTVSHGGGASYDAVNDTHTINGDGTYGPSTHTRGDARLNGTFHSFPGVRPDGSGTIVLVTTQPSGTNAAFNGLLLEAKDPAAAGYVGWSGLFAGFADTDPAIDFDSDGLASGIEWVVDGDPTANDAASVAPTFDNTADPDDFLFTFRRRDDAAADPNTTIVVEYGSDLDGWATAQDGVDDVTITVVDDGFGTSAIDGVGVDQVTVAIPRALAVDGRLFVRLRVTVVTP